jgi:hypothetical protein
MKDRCETKRQERGAGSVKKMKMAGRRGCNGRAGQSGKKKNMEYAVDAKGRIQKKVCEIEKIESTAAKLGSGNERTLECLGNWEHKEEVEFVWCGADEEDDDWVDADTEDEFEIVDF